MEKHQLLGHSRAKLAQRPQERPVSSPGPSNLITRISSLKLSFKSSEATNMTSPTTQASWMQSCYSAGWAMINPWKESSKKER